jgi:hypothetical protein
MNPDRLVRLWYTHEYRIVDTSSRSSTGTFSTRPSDDRTTAFRIKKKTMRENDLRIGLAHQSKRIVPSEHRDDVLLRKGRDFHRRKVPSLQAEVARKVKSCPPTEHLPTCWRRSRHHMVVETTRKGKTKRLRQCDALNLFRFQNRYLRRPVHVDGLP